MTNRAIKASAFLLTAAAVMAVCLPGPAYARSTAQHLERQKQAGEYSHSAIGTESASNTAAQKRIKDLFKNKPAPPPISGKRFGGPCRYTSYPGRCTIQSVRKTADSIHQKSVGGGPGYEGYDIKYKYTGRVPPRNRLAMRAIARTHAFRLTNSWYPGPEYIAKYAIVPGKTFACILKVIVKGACTPVVFYFPSIDSADYFEHGR